MRKNKSGFTIIEVVLVLAIAGLIFVMVFIALPALQQSQRNTQRRDDVDRVMAAIVDYQKNNHGKSPLIYKEGDTFNSNFEKFVTRYIDSQCEGSSTETNELLTFNSCGPQFTDPSGSPYVLQYQQWNADNTNLTGYWRNGSEFDRTLHIYRNAACGKNEGETIHKDGQNQLAIFMILEGGSIYCVDNS